MEEIVQEVLTKAIPPATLNILDALKLDKALRLAKQKFKEGSSEEAKRIYKDILNRFPKNKKAIYGMKALSGGPAGKAAKTQDPPQNQLQTLINLYNQGHLQQALDEVSQFLQKFPSSPTLFTISGATNMGLGQLGAAVESYKQALALKPDYAEVYNNMGVALQEQGKLEEAIEAFNKAVVFKTDYAEAYNNLGNTLKDKGKLEEALDALNKAVVLKPDYAEAYFNLGIILKDQGSMEEAIEAYNKALAIKSDYAEAYNNLGVALKEQGNLAEAIDAFTSVLFIKPDYADAYYNIGTALKEQGKLEEAIEAYKKALALKPDYADAYNNIGIALTEQDKIAEAVDAFNNALAFNSDHVEAWNNIAFPLQAIKTQLSSNQELGVHCPEVSNTNYARIARSILHYRLNRGGERKGSSFDETLRLLSSAKNITIPNPTFDGNSRQPVPVLPNKIVALHFFGRSGTGLLHSLIDGHPEVSTLPSVYFSEYFDHSTWEKIISGGWSKMADRFMSIYEVMFDASARNPIPSKSVHDVICIGRQEGMANVGNQRDEVLSVDRRLFRSKLNYLMNCYDELDAFAFFKLVNAAYGEAINDLNKKSLIFYHIHNPHTYAQLNFVRSVPNANWIMMVREPIQSCESSIRTKFYENNYSGLSMNIVAMLFLVDNIVYSKQKSIGVRLEDLKENPRKTIRALCKWMGIEETESLYEMTAQGKKWWGDPSSPDYEKDGMEPFGEISIKRKVGSIFSDYDQFILRTLFYPFSVQFGYIEENFEQFKIDLQAIRPMLNEMFDFERTIVERTENDPNHFMTSGSYLHLRSVLIERWNTLNKFGTYPNMIKPFEIN